MLSLVNTRLRDGQELSDFCADYCVGEDELVARLFGAGYAFDGEENKFKGI